MKITRVRKAVASALAAGALVTGIGLASAATANAGTTYIFQSQSSCNAQRSAVLNNPANSKPRGQFQVYGLSASPCALEYGKWQFTTQWVG